MLNVANETVWTSLAHKVPGALGTDHCGYGLDGMLCAFVVSWRLTAPDIIRSQRRSKPWATAFAPHLIIPQHYSNGLLRNMHYPIRRSRPPFPPNTEEIIQANTYPKQGWRSTKHALRTCDVSIERLQNRTQWSSNTVICIYQRAAYYLFRIVFNWNLGSNLYHQCIA